MENFTQTTPDRRKIQHRQFLPWRQAIGTLLFMTILLGGIYPAICTLILQTFFPEKAAGSFIRDQSNTPIGSVLIGQEFTQPQYFWGRPSATEKSPYSAANSQASNLSNSNPELLKNVTSRIEKLKQYDHPSEPIPIDLVTSSGSGLDPHITVAAAYYQIPRIAKVRHLDESIIRNLVNQHTHKSWIFTSDYINVLTLNMDLDKLGESHD